MNTSSLVAHKKLLAIIIGVAIIATAGMSAASAQTPGPTGQTHTPPKITGSINIEQTLMSKVTVSFSDAANTAAAGSTSSPITGGKVISGSLKPMQGYLVYAFKVIDSNNMVYTVIVDPSSGSILYVSTGHTFHGFGMGQPGGMMRGHHMGGQGWNKQSPPGSAAPSSSGTTTPSDWTTNGLQ
jgi:Peptidase propeptide and YPEB domain